MREDTTGEVLTITNNGQENQLVKMAFLELKKYRETSKDEVRKPWLEFFGINPLPSNPSELSAKQINCWTTRAGPRRTGKCLVNYVMREEQALLAQDYALEQAEERGLERGLERVLNKV